MNKLMRKNCYDAIKTFSKKRVTLSVANVLLIADQRLQSGDTVRPGHPDRRHDVDEDKEDGDE